MCYNLKTPNGGTEAVIDDNCGVSKFYAIAQTLANDLQVRFLNQVDETESLNWDFKYKDELLTLHFSMFNGVSIIPSGYNTHNVMEVANFLQKRVY
ncbi:MAG: hypothetical protein IPO46_08325 [Chitinophagaceae bacterium]|jgi:hypothetical protein|nr:hypothetical protein [Chitinophagaceae bacterium]MBP6046636.1 hypothetical protein [Ferruginibacter sp.]NMD28863.1 hypothetical protein [Bacteroidota bacterium]MBK7088647.1 hypothetical protein [Chitinophagaceae bacterium]MBK7345704.1 hypothetical protein [Chitinophagaceae bacterium]